MEVRKLVIFIGYFILFINLLFYLKSYRNKSIAFKVIIGYLLYTSILQLITHLYARKGMNNLFLSHYYFIGQFIFLSYFYYKILDKPVFKKVIIVFFSIVITLLGIQFFNSPELYYTFSLGEITLCFIPIILYTLFYFHESFGVENKKYLILSSGVFFYLLSSILIFLVGNLLVSSNSLFKRTLWDINAFLYVIYQLLIFIEWYINFRKPTPVSINDEDEIHL